MPVNRSVVVGEGAMAILARLNFSGARSAAAMDG